MSRSHKKIAIGAVTTAETDKKYKVKANRKYRRISKELMKYLGEKEMKKKRETSSVWDFPKDGKKYFHNFPKIYRKW